METRPGKGVFFLGRRGGKGVLIEEVSNHQETLALAGLGKFSNLGGQPNWEEKLNKAHRLRA